MRSKVFALTTIIILFALMTPLSCIADQLEKLVDIATSDAGRNGAWYGYDSEWCARVVKYWAGQAGLSDSIPAVYSACEMAFSFHINGNRFSLTHRDSSGEIRSWTSGSWSEELPTANYEYSPHPGDLVFLETNGNSSDGIDSVGICVGVISDFQIDVAVGDVGNSNHAESTVQINTYNWKANDSCIWGFVCLSSESKEKENDDQGENAQEFPVAFMSGDYRAVDLGDGTCEIIEYNGGWYGQYVDDLAFFELYIPNTLEGLQVARIGSNAFFNCYDGVERIVIPEGVTSIADSAFYSVERLSSVVLPASLTVIEGNPFRECYGLKEIVVEADNHSFHMEDCFLIDEKERRLIIAIQPEEDIDIPKEVVAIGDRAFYHCEGITSIKIPEQVISVGKEAFFGCSKLERITFREGLSSVGNGAFACCDSLVSITFPASLSKIDGNPVYGCDNLESINISPENPLLEINNGFLINSEEKRLIAAVQPHGNITIPEDVESIGDFAFYECDELSNVSFPDGVRHIGTSAFDHCISLVSASLSDGLETIGDSAFCGCNLSELIIPEGVTDIGESAFRYCDHLKRVILPFSLKKIGAFAFYDCEALKTVNIPEGVVSLGEYAFAYCPGLNKITLPSSLNEMGANPFMRDLNIESFLVSEQNTAFKMQDGMLLDMRESLLISVLTEKSAFQIPEDIKVIGESAFSYHTDMEYIELPQSLECIEDWAFDYCVSLERIEIPQNVTNIGTGSFYHCKNLVSISIGDSVEHIGNAAFKDCYDLQSVVVPRSMKSIGDQAFAETDIQIIAFLGENTEIGFNIFAGTYTWPSVIIGHSGTFAETLAGKYGNFWDVDKLIPGGDFLAMEMNDGTCEIISYKGNEENLIIPEEMGGKRVTRIAEEVFESHEELLSVVLPSGITHIGDSAFARCDNLSKVDIPNGIKEIGNDAFFGCSSLVEVILPEGIIRIGERAFQCCDSLESVVIPEGTKSLESGVFAACRQLKSVTLPKSLTDVGDNPFEGCENLVTVNLHHENTYFHVEDKYLIDKTEKRLISALPSLTSANIPDGIAIIGKDAFASCSQLCEVVLPEGLESIGYGSFRGCSMIRELKIPGSVKRIEDFAFDDCDGLSSITFMEGNTCISSQAFQDCNHLRTIFILHNDLVWENPWRHDFHRIEFVGYPNSAAEKVAMDLGNGLVDINRRLAFGNYSAVDLGDGTCRIVFYGGEEQVVSIPSEIEGLQVVSIGDSAFCWAEGLQEVYIPEGITCIGKLAFANCKDLRKVVLPQSVVSIEDCAFINCKKLVYIKLPKNITYIGENVFWGSDNIMWK